MVRAWSKSPEKLLNLPLLSIISCYQTVVYPRGELIKSQKDEYETFQPQLQQLLSLRSLMILAKRTHMQSIWPVPKEKLKHSNNGNYPIRPFFIFDTEFQVLQATLTCWQNNVYTIKYQRNTFSIKERKQHSGWVIPENEIMSKKTYSEENIQKI